MTRSPDDNGLFDCGAIPPEALRADPQPVRIWAKTHGASTDVISGQRGLLGGWNEHRRDGQVEYVRADLYEALRADPQPVASQDQLCAAAFEAGLQSAAEIVADDHVCQAILDRENPYTATPSSAPASVGDAVEYVRADLYEALRAERDALREAVRPFFGDPVMEGLLWSDASPYSLVTICVQKRIYDSARRALHQTERGAA